MIDNILGNKTNILVLRFLTKFNGQFFSADEIAKETGTGLRNTYDSLKMLSYDNIISKKFSHGKTYYKYVVDSAVKNFIFQIFEEERKKIFLQNLSFYKLISEIEMNIVQIAGSSLVDIILYGSIAKGRDTLSSDLDLCVIINKDDEKIKKEISQLAFENKFKKEIQIQVFTSQEFLSAEKSGNPLIENIIRDGLSLKIGK